ncbi:uncharacterized protein BKA78DRAFT_19565 [Phyllosticta capitalensis]|uniref:uncharacterized protein n=1 Tax=Phyllosticta capitalensis TaxID=121624 RepID=UPI00312EA200
MVSLGAEYVDGGRHKEWLRFARERSTASYMYHPQLPSRDLNTLHLPHDLSALHSHLDITLQPTVPQQFCTQISRATPPTNASKIHNPTSPTPASLPCTAAGVNCIIARPPPQRRGSATAPLPASPALPCAGAIKNGRFVLTVPADVSHVRRSKFMRCAVRKNAFGRSA